MLKLLGIIICLCIGSFCPLLGLLLMYAFGMLKL